MVDCIQGSVVLGAKVCVGKRRTHQKGSYRLIKSVESLNLASGSTAQNDDMSVSNEGRLMQSGAMEGVGSGAGNEGSEASRADKQSPVHTMMEMGMCRSEPHLK